MTLPPIIPDEVRADLARRAARPSGPARDSPRHAGVAGSVPPGATARARLAAIVAPDAATAHDRDAILTSISASYFRLRRGLAALAFALPVVVWLGAGVDHLQPSLSAYYHFAAAHPDTPGAGTMRDVFVGVLWAIGSFLVLYRGYSTAENWTLNVAGVAAIVIAVSPMDWPAAAPATTHGTLHYAAASLFFVALAYVAVFRSRDTLVLLPPATRARFAAAYRTCGVLMVSVPLAVATVYRVLHGLDSVWLLVVEVAGVWTFAAFWAIKSHEIMRIEAGTA